MGTPGQCCWVGRLQSCSVLPPSAPDGSVGEGQSDPEFPMAAVTNYHKLMA